VVLDDATLGSAHVPLRDKVCSELRQRIIDGAYEPGDRLTEERLAATFGVSRNPVREALRVLESEGFLMVSPRRGAIVANVARGDIDDLFDVRKALEVLAARLAAARATDTQVDGLRHLLDQARAATEAGDLARLAGLNTRFHAQICRLSGNRLLDSMMEPLHGRLQWIFRQSAVVRAPHSWQEHLDLVQAIAAGDADKAAASAAEHVNRARASAEELAQSSRLPPPWE
jgi:DNA-binding GntR family transcriptional regulator